MDKEAILTEEERENLHRDWANETGDVFNLLRRVSLEQYYKMGKLGYRKLPKDKPPLLNCEDIDSLKCTYERCGQTQHNTDAHKLCQAQREIDIKWFGGQ